MSFRFEWNPYADQPHNVAPRRQRLKHHVQHASTYFKLAASNLRRAVPILSLYHHYHSHLYQNPVQINNPFAVAISQAESRNEQVVKLLKETGVESTLVRVPSWEKEKLDLFQEFFKLINSENMGLTVALLQNRDDVLRPSSWFDFVEGVFSRFRHFSSYFEIGHAWNRTKWGVWDYEEYLKLAYSAQGLAKKYKVKLVGPAVIDFEFHLYPAVLEKIIFDKVSSLLYVDRAGAPEDRQFGWDTPAKLALLKAVIDGSGRQKHDLWITEVNWPLKGTGKYSPASGKPNVSEEKQADYLVRYYIFCIASGLVEKIFWWQLAAPGYGLVDTRGNEWRKRPSYYAFQNMVRQLRQSTFLGRVAHPPLQIFLFQKNEQEVAVCWKRGIPLEYTFSKKICRVLDRDGLEIKTSNNKIIINESPQYVFLNQDKGESLPLERRTLPLHSVGFKEDEVEDYERRRYRGLDQRIVDWRERRILKNLLKRINRHSTRVLDIPSGYGRFSSLLLEHCFILTSCDLSFYMVKRALTKKRPSGRQWGVVADAKKGLPFKKGSFTLLLSIRFFHHLHSHQEREFILREFACLSSRWLIISYYKRTIFHLIQRKFRRKLKRSRTRIKMLPGHELKEEIAQTGWRLLREYSLCKGLHAQHIALLEKI